MANSTFLILLWCAALVSSGILVVILAVVIAEALPAIRELQVSRFFTDDGWYPTHGRFEVSAMLVGTGAVAIGACLLGVPIGVLSAIFLRFYATGWLGEAYQRLVEVLAGVPSVVFGFWGLTTIVPLVNRWEPPGSSLLAAILVLALMVLPTVTLISYASLCAVPFRYYQGAMGLGFTHWNAVVRVAIPAAGRGIATGCVLALSRALGETMAVVMVAGNIPQIPRSLFDPVRTLSASIALEVSYAVDLHRSALFASGLLLVGGVLLAFLVSRFLELG